MKATNLRKLAEAREALRAVRARIEAFDGGDRPPSPPASLLREEQRLLTRVGWLEEVELFERKRKSKTPKRKPAPKKPSPSC